MIWDNGKSAWSLLLNFLFGDDAECIKLAFSIGWTPYNIYAVDFHEIIAVIALVVVKCFNLWCPIFRLKLLFFFFTSTLVCVSSDFTHVQVQFYCLKLLFRRLTRGFHFLFYFPNLLIIQLRDLPKIDTVKERFINFFRILLNFGFLLRSNLLECWI